MPGDWDKLPSKGHSNALYIVLTIICWVALRIFGSMAFGMAFETRIASMLGGWLFGIVSYVILAIIVAKLEDKDEKYDNTDWKNRNNPNSTETEKSTEK